MNNLLQNKSLKNSISSQSAGKIGLVFSGGGGKGAYEIGVWRALEEYGVAANIGAIAGTSVGALNGALFAQGNLHHAEEIWKSISPDAILTPHDLWIYLERLASFTSTLPHLAKIIEMWFRSHLSNQGGLSQAGLSTLIQNHVDLQRIRAFPGPVYAVAYNVTRNRLDYFDLRNADTLERLESQLLASASIPLVFGKTYVDGCLYLDGGIPIIGDNTPVKALYETGIRTIVVVHLSQEPPIDRSLYPDCHIIEIMPQNDLGSTLNFNADQAKLNMQRGYKDASWILKQFYQIGESQTRCSSAIIDIIQTSQMFEEEYQKYTSRYQEDEQAVEALLSQL